MRRIKLLIVLGLLPCMLSAQELVTVKGRIVNQQGEGIEYVQLGVPKLQIGAISDADGCFKIEVPCDTLEFFHVSYQKGLFPVSGPTDDLVIVLQENELPPAVSIGGNTKEKYLMRPGTILKNIGIICTSVQGGRPSGRELGSVAKATKPFLVKNIQFSVRSNHIPGCVASINIYRVEGKKESFVNVLHRPIYFKVAVSPEPQYFDIRPDEPLLLEPGRYFIAFQVVGYDESVQQSPEMTMDFNIFLKNSYIREAALGKMEHFPVNIGIAVKGLEYQ